MIGQSLREFREIKNLQPKEMAAKMKVSASFYYKVESGDREPSYRFICKFKEAFNINVDDIFF